MGEKSYSLVNIKTHRKNEDKECSRRTIYEISIVLILVGIIAYLLYEKYYIDQGTAAGVTTCKEAECYEFALDLSNFVDLSADPCRDFHQYVCGGYFTTALVKQISDPLTEKMKEVFNELQSFIVTPISDNDANTVKLQKSFFQSCLDVELMSDEPVLQLLEEVGGWPVLEGSKWKEDKFNWQSVMSKCQQLGLPFLWFLRFDIHVDNKTNYFHISYPAITHTASNRKDYIKSIVNSIDKKATFAPNEIDKVLQFENRLSQIFRNQTAETSLGIVQDLQEFFPKYKWLNFLGNLTEGFLEITENTTIAFNINSYIYELDKLLIKTDNRTIANYIGWRILQYFAPYMSLDVRNIYDKYVKSKDISRVDFCIASTIFYFPYVSETEYIRKYVDNETRQSAEEMTNMLKEEMLTRIENAWKNNEGWLNNVSSQYYLKKFKDTENVIGGQAEIFDEEFYDNNFLHIGNLSFDTTNFSIIEMITERSKSFYKSLFNSVGNEGIDRENINLYGENVKRVKFDTEKNRLIVPSSLLHEPFYQNNQPKYLNYGGLGSLIAQELIQKFLKILKNDDESEDIWRHKDYKVYQNGTECYEKDFHHILQNQTPLNASHVVQNIIGDVIGRNLAYSAYQNWLEQNKEELPLPLLQLSNHQLFWIASGLANCHQYPMDDQMEEKFSIPGMKNIMSLRHSRHFAEDFQCPTESLMNPAKVEKCWLFL